MAANLAGAQKLAASTCGDRSAILAEKPRPVKVAATGGQGGGSPELAPRLALPADSARAAGANRGSLGPCAGGPQADAPRAISFEMLFTNELRDAGKCLAPIAGPLAGIAAAIGLAEFASAGSQRKVHGSVTRWCPRGLMSPRVEESLRGLAGNCHSKRIAMAPTTSRVAPDELKAADFEANDALCRTH